MKRKFLMEEDDGQPNITYTKFDAFSDGLKEGTASGMKLFFWFLIFFIVCMIYFISSIF